ncbi:MAG: hypothetical protein ABGW97_04965 [Christiangramia sp.]|uniref:hypothetical protein n=1 Tax=Christiangramia sp. TaxID=1931228 RepID=UPI0032420890
MKKIITFLVWFFFIQNSLFAQVTCEKVSPLGTAVADDSRGFMDAVIISIAVIIVLFTLIMSLKYIFKPGEKDPNHIKNIVRDEGF